MKIVSTLSRRRLLSAVPAVAATMAPAAASFDKCSGALGGLAMGADAELLALKPAFDEVFAEWWQQHLDDAAHRIPFEAELERRTGMTRAQSWELLRTDRAEWEATYEPPMEEMFKENPSEDIDDEESNRRCAKRYELIDAILDFTAATREGLALQCRAMIMDNFGDWHDGRTPQFVASVAAFAGAELPAPAEEMFDTDDA